MTTQRATASLFQAVTVFLRKNVTDALHVCMVLFRIMIPIMIAMKILQEVGLVDIVGSLASPVMHVFGLPGAMSLVWITGMFTNLYGGAVVLITLLPSTPLTTAQVTVLATMMLIAHSLPVELSIARRSGARLRAQLAIRLGGAMLCGWLLSSGYGWLGWGGALAQPAWIPDAPAVGWVAWMLGEARNLAGIAVIVLFLLIVLDILKRLGVTDLMIRFLSPLFRSMGVGREAGTITIVGVTLGLSYGGGLIIHEARSGNIPARDIFFALTFMGLSHSLIEDTLLMLLLGADLTGILWGRLAFTTGVMWLLTLLVSVMSERMVHSTLVRPPAGQAKV